jgi:murein DD-endopeptidase MepM/ murein hydrolase activator NlpD
VRASLPLLIGLACGSDTAEDSGAVAESGPPLLFSLPLAQPDLFEIVVGVDHDPEIQDSLLGQAICTDYARRSFPHCYDEHDGSDYILHGGFSTMDDGSVAILAAAPGEVVETEDGHYDRCHGDLSSGDVDCDGHEMEANFVILEHESGHRSWYWHMMNGSVSVEVGAHVEAGALLGQVGSSGKSSQPHLHFELQDSQGNVIDPYAGEYSQAESWWCDQGGLDDIPGSCEEG